jgi:hypothetical protein
VIRAREKLLKTVRASERGAAQTKTAKVLEASNLRAFYKMYIIGN